MVFLLRIALLLPEVFSGDQLRDLGGEEGLQSKEAFFTASSAAF